MMHAAQAITLRKNFNPLLAMGKGTAAAYKEFRKSIPWYDRDRTISADIEKAFKIVEEGAMLRAAIEAVGNDGEEPIVWQSKD